MSNIKNIFISHTHEDDTGCDKLKDILKKSGMQVKDYSITKDKPNQAKDENYIKSSKLAPKINQSSCLVVYLTENTKDSKWVKWETEYASKLNKRIVAVYANGEKDCEVPNYIDDLADAIVGWTGDKIVGAINGENTFEKRDGSSYAERGIKYYGC